MVEGMGWLMGLCPPPEEWTLGDLCAKFGVLPSQITDPDDLKFLAAYAAKESLVSSWEMWHQVVKNPGMSMSSDTIDYMLDLMKEAKQRCRKR